MKKDIFAAMPEMPQNEKKTEFSLVEKPSRLDGLAWYLMVLGFISILFAGLFFYLGNIDYRDYMLNGNAMGRYLIIGGVASYFTGRGISYYRRFRKKRAER